MVTVVITVGGESVTLNKDNTVLINGMSEKVRTAKTMNITHEGDVVTLNPYGIDLSITWRGLEHKFFAELQDSRYSGAVCGLLGNADGDKRNDFRKRDGMMTLDTNEFGESWKVPGMR
ncbi:von Willebrand factor-like [Glandiceps talaboti]